MFVCESVYACLCVFVCMFVYVFICVCVCVCVFSYIEKKWGEVDEAENTKSEKLRKYQYKEVCVRALSCKIIEKDEV